MWQNSSTEIINFCYIKEYIYRLHFDTQILLWVFKDRFNKHGCNFNEVSKIAYSRVLEIKLFLNKGYDVIISVHDITKFYHVT